jgi:hypothetical protein
MDGLPLDFVHPSLCAVMAMSTVSHLVLLAGVCTALTHATGNAVWDAVGSIAVGGLLGLIAVFLVQKNRDLLLGRSMGASDVQVRAWWLRQMKTHQDVRNQYKMRESMHYSVLPAPSLPNPNSPLLPHSSSSSSSSSLHFQLRPACGLHEYTSQAALEHTQATITRAGPANHHPPRTCTCAQFRL